MAIDLSVVQGRVLESLLGKSRPTPDAYSLSLGALVNAFNQKSSREPDGAVETDLLEALDSLVSVHLVSEKTPSGSRVTKYSHRLANTLGPN